MPRKTLSVNTEMGTDTKVICSIGRHTLIFDQSKAGGGEDLGPSPLESFLASIAACVSSIARIVAKQQQIPLRGIKISTSADIDTDVLLGRRSDTRAGFTLISLEAVIDADIPIEQKQEFLKEVEQRCPVSENTLNPTTITIKVVP